ncbi:hypothetical protein [Ligilactobacillus acidipiscis]|uniref:hypothetical protein n=1 Tax=Ligilactobacillus acidipiscis TaxID=89059 RepID=UPI0023F7A91B|nr:hypothetical protein [Ligilactobacillus acidipiscis]WEV56681.1 hypothetical protein OZX66_10720 [Ligilactobacillus acidipiscis]
MQRGLFKFIGEVVEDYPDYDKYIEQKENEITDRNRQLGVTESNSEQGYTPVTIGDDRSILALKRKQKAVEDALKQSDDVTRDIIYELYLRENKLYDLRGLTAHLMYSKSQIMRLRDGFFDKVARELWLE